MEMLKRVVQGRASSSQQSEYPKFEQTPFKPKILSSGLNHSNQRNEDVFYGKQYSEPEILLKYQLERIPSQEQTKENKLRRRSKTRSLSKEQRECSYLETHIIPNLMDKVVAALIDQTLNAITPIFQRKLKMRNDYQIQQLIKSYSIQSMNTQTQKCSNRHFEKRPSQQQLSNEQKQADIVVVGGLLPANSNPNKIAAQCKLQLAAKIKQKNMILQKLKKKLQQRPQNSITIRKNKSLEKNSQYQSVTSANQNLSLRINLVARPETTVKRNSQLQNENLELGLQRNSVRIKTSQGFYKQGNEFTTAVEDSSYEQLKQLSKSKFCISDTQWCPTNNQKYQGEYSSKKASSSQSRKVMKPQKASLIEMGQSPQSSFARRRIQIESKHVKSQSKDKRDSCKSSKIKLLSLDKKQKLPQLNAKLSKHDQRKKNFEVLEEINLLGHLETLSNQQAASMFKARSRLSIYTTATKDQSGTKKTQPSNDIARLKQFRKSFYNPPAAENLPDHSVGYDSYIDQMEQRIQLRKNKQIFPYRKQFTMPKRLPSNSNENMLADSMQEHSSLDITDPEHEFSEGELQLLEINK